MPADYRLWVNDDRTVLIRMWANDKVEVCFRHDAAAIWGPANELIEETVPNPALNTGLRTLSKVLREHRRIPPP